MRKELHSVENIVTNLGPAINSRLAFINEGVMKGFKQQSLLDLYAPITDITSDMSVPFGYVGDDNTKNYDDYGPNYTGFESTISPLITRFVITNITWVEPEDITYNYYTFDELTEMVEVGWDIANGRFTLSQDRKPYTVNSALINYHGYLLDIKFLEKITYTDTNTSTAESLWGENVFPAYLPRSLENQFNNQVKLRQQLIQNGVSVIDLATIDNATTVYTHGYKVDSAAPHRLYFYSTNGWISFNVIWLGIKYNKNLNKIETQFRVDFPSRRIVGATNKYAIRYEINSTNYNKEITPDTLFSEFLIVAYDNDPYHNSSNPTLQTYFEDVASLGILDKIYARSMMFAPITIKTGYNYNELYPNPETNQNASLRSIIQENVGGTLINYALGPDFNPIIYQLYEKVFDLIQMKAFVYNEMLGGEWVYLPIGVIMFPSIAYTNTGRANTITSMTITNDPFVADTSMQYTSLAFNLNHTYIDNNEVNIHYTGGIHGYSKIYPYKFSDTDYRYLDNGSIVDRLSPIGYYTDYRIYFELREINFITINNYIYGIGYVNQILPEWDRFNTSIDSLLRQIGGIYMDLTKKYLDLETLFNINNNP